VASNKNIPMNIDFENNTPAGLYVLSGLLLLSTLGILYYALTVPSYVYLGMIFIPLFIYMGVGIIKRWPGSRQTVMAFAMLMFVGAIANLIVFFYLRSAKVKAYFKQAI
tara:strand:+ start:2231 stop:2557 length:327 start_codon:yes stop_codon:yes gene_type:complete